MSSTKRGGQRSVADFYPTPAFCVTRLLERVPLPGGYWLEPGAGEGALIRAVDHLRDDVKWRAVELRKECKRGLRKLTKRVTIGSFLSPLPMLRANGKKYRVALGNPPFRLAMEFVQQGLRSADYVVMLLRLNFIGSVKRSNFFCKHMPDIYVLPNRPSFAASGKTDSIEYAWFLWPPKRRRRTGKIELLATTPPEERKR